MNAKKLIFTGILFSFFISASAWAASYDIKNMTPEIQQALSGRQSRYSELQNLKASGAVGETSQGYVAALKPVPGAEEIANQENQDRRVIYQAIVSQNALGPQGMNEVERAFGEVQRDKARSGDMIQTSSGSWTQK